MFGKFATPQGPYPGCTEYQKNQNILKHKANYGGTFAQARETLYPRGPSYSGVVKERQAVF